MIQPLRVVHRRAFVALAVLLPVILVVGLVARHPRPGLGAQVRQLPASSQFVGGSIELWQKHAIRSKFYNTSNRPQDIYLVLQPAQDLNEPDLLLYWAASAPNGDVLPSEAKLVGAFRAGKAFLLPLNEKGAGHLVLFS